MTASIVDVYEKGISTAGMSKAYSLAGLRLGWIAGPQAILEPAMIHRDYDTISVGMIDDHSITRGNLTILEAWVDAEPLISWVKPRSGTTALLKYDLPQSSREFCVSLLQATGVMFTPGSALDMEGYVRIGYANNQEILKEGLARVSKYLATRR